MFFDTVLATLAPYTFQLNCLNISRYLVDSVKWSNYKFVSSFKESINE